MAIAMVKILGGGGGGIVSHGNLIGSGRWGGGAISPLANPLTMAVVVCMTDDGG